jgi:hypothetical protein
LDESVSSVADSVGEEGCKLFGFLSVSLRDHLF